METINTLSQRNVNETLNMSDVKKMLVALATSFDAYDHFYMSGLTEQLNGYFEFEYEETSISFTADAYYNEFNHEATFYIPEQDINLWVNEDKSVAVQSSIVEKAFKSILIDKNF